MNALIGWLLLHRFFAAIATLWFVATAVFVITNLLPGDVAQELLGHFARQKQLQIRGRKGLDNV